MEIGYGDMTSTPTLSHFPATDDRGPELGSADPPEDWIPGALLRWVVAPLVALWCAFLVLTWLPSYLTWPWQNDSEHFAMLAQLWDSGKLPYRDMFSTQFPGEIYLHYLLGKAFGWGNTAAYYAFDAALVLGFGILLVAWGRRRNGALLPGLIGFSTFLLYYVSQNTLVAGERDWHAAFLAMCSLLLPGLGSGRTLQTLSAVAFGLALAMRPQVFLLLPAIFLALHGSAQSRGESWKQIFVTFVGWGVVAGAVTALGFLPLVWAGILGDFLGCMKTLVQPPYNTTSPGQILVRLSPQKHPAVLLAVTALIVLLWNGTAGPNRRHAWVVLAAVAGVLFYAAISPIRNAYHAIPQVAVAALGVNLPRDSTPPIWRPADSPDCRGGRANVLVLRRECQAPLVQGAETRDGDIRPADGVARAPQRRDAPVHSAGLLLRLPLERPSRLDGLPATAHDFGHPGRQFARRTHLGRHQRDPTAHAATRRLELSGDVSHPFAGRTRRHGPGKQHQPVRRSLGPDRLVGPRHGVLPAVRDGPPSLPVRNPVRVARSLAPPAGERPARAPLREVRGGRRDSASRPWTLGALVWRTTSGS